MKTLKYQYVDEGHVIAVQRRKKLESSRPYTVSTYRILESGGSVLLSLETFITRAEAERNFRIAVNAANAYASWV